MHECGDEWFIKNGKDLNSAIYEFERICRRYGGILIFGKEKYGCYIDDATTLWDGGSHYFIYKSPYYIRNNFIYWKIDPIIKFITKNIGLHFIIVKYQKTIYNYAMQKVCKKYSNVIDEMILYLDNYRLVTPGIFGKINGEEIHNKYWRTL